MEKEIREEKLQNLATQFRCPSGRDGLKTGRRMFETNRHITELSVEALHLQESDVVLEIGMGLGLQAEMVLQSAPNIRYMGVEMSPLMLEHAQAINCKRVQEKAVALYLSDGKTLPLGDASCSKIFTVNTLYFWEDANTYLREIYRVLADNGLFCLTFASDEFMKKLPFSNLGFNLYSCTQAENLFHKTDFKLLNTTSIIEPNVYHVTGYADREVYFIVAGK